MPNLEMNASQMCHHVTFPPELLGALGTRDDVLHLPVNCLHMQEQISLLSERPVALGALEGSRIRGVKALVHLQAIITSEPLSTLVAGEGFLLRVGDEVLLITMVIKEFLPTEETHSSPRPF